MVAVLDLSKEKEQIPVLDLSGDSGQIPVLNLSEDLSQRKILPSEAVTLAQKMIRSPEEVLREDIPSALAERGHPLIAGTLGTIAELTPLTFTEAGIALAIPPVAAKIGRPIIRRFPFLTKPIEIFKRRQKVSLPSIPEELGQEARKFKTADEFVESHQKVFRGGDAPIDVARGTKQGISVTTDREVAENFIAPEKGVVGEAFLPKSAKILREGDIPKNLQDAYLKEANKLANVAVDVSISDSQFNLLRTSVLNKQKEIVEYARKAGFDAVDFPFEQEIRVIKPYILKTKSQLTDIYNQAVKKIPPAIPKVKPETELKKLPLEADIKATVGKLDQALSQIEEVAKTGTFQPKEIRPELAKGLPASEKSFVNREVVAQANELFIRTGRELKRIKDIADRTVDDFTNQQLDLVKERFQIAFAKRQEAARTASESLREFQYGVREVKDILVSLNLIKDVKPKIAALDKIILGSLRSVSLKTAEQFAKKIGVEQIPESLQVGRAVVDYLKVNLFSMGSWTLDAFTNAVSVGTKLPGYLLEDIYNIAKTGNPARTAGIFSALKRQGKGLGSALKERSMKEIYRLPDEIEFQLGRAVGGEKIGVMTNLKVQGFPLDYVVSLPVRMKRGTDVIFSRTMALADLVSSGIKDAGKLGLKGKAKEEFIEAFIKNPDEIAKSSAIKLGKQIRFDVDLSKLEESIGRSMGMQLLGEVFPRWTFQFGRWMGRTLGANPELFNKIKTGKTTPVEVIKHLSEAATGWGGIYLVNDVLYPNVDFNSMEYVNEKKERIRLSGRSPIPEALLLNAMMRGDWDKAKKALAFTSFPFAKLVAGEPSGFLGNWINAMRESMEGRFTSERFRAEIENMVNRAIPGQAVLSTLKTIFDSTLRKGIGAEIPIVSEMLPAKISPATGKPLQPKQKIPGLDVEIPAIGGIVLPGAKRVLSDVEQELLAHGIGLFRPRRTAIAEFEAEDVPRELREKFEKKSGKFLNEFVQDVLKNDQYLKAPFDKQSELLRKLKSLAERKAKFEITKESGKMIKERPIPMRQRLLPSRVLETINVEPVVEGKEQLPVLNLSEEVK